MKDHNLRYTGYKSVEELKNGLEDFINQHKNIWKIYASSSRYPEKSLSFSGSAFKVTTDVSGSDDKTVYKGEDINEACEVYLKL